VWQLQASLSSITNKMQRYTIFFIMSMLYVFQALSPPIIRSSKTVYKASDNTKLACCYRYFKYNQQDATLYNILYYVSALYVSGGFFAHH
jgi:hypothetical protein